MYLSKGCRCEVVLCLWFCCYFLLAASQVTDPTEVEALRTIKRSLIDINGNLSNWDRGDPCTSNWTGVMCSNTTLADGNLHVLQLCAINVSDGQTFLDMIINQIEMLNSKYGCRVPLLLFDKNDIGDHKLKVLEKYSKSSVEVHTLKPGESGELKLSGEHSSKEEMHPFDDVEVFRSLMTGGTLDSLLSQGKEYILVLKSDNVATIVDPNILNHLMINDIEYCMEVTPNQSFNLILTAMKFKLGEIARNQDKNLKNNFKLIDTTNMWVSLRAIKRFVDADELKQEKPSVFKFFGNVIGVSVPESRFFPLDVTSDLLLLQSDLYTCREGVLTRNPARTNHSNPVIDLGPEFEKISDFQSRFKSIPSIIELDSLRVRGDVWFGANITLKGRVTISTKPDLKLEIPDGVTIENKEINDLADI